MLESIMQIPINFWYSAAPTLLYDLFMIRKSAGARAELMGELKIQEGEKVIEVGVGTGLNLDYYPPVADIYCLDINEKLLRTASQVATELGRHDITFVLGNARNLRFEDDTFDVGILTYALSAIPGNKKALSEMERVVKPGGRIGILDYAWLQFPNPLLNGNVALNLQKLVENRQRSRVMYHKSGLSLSLCRQRIYILEVNK